MIAWEFFWLAVNVSGATAGWLCLASSIRIKHSPFFLACIGFPRTVCTLSPLLLASLFGSPFILLGAYFTAFQASFTEISILALFISPPLNNVISLPRYRLIHKGYDWGGEKLHEWWLIWWCRRNIFLAVQTFGSSWADRSRWFETKIFHPAVLVH